MNRKERQWLVSVLMTIVMTMSVFSVPTAAFAAGEEFGGFIDTYVNSDGQQIAVETTADGFIYQKVNSDGQDVIKVYGYVGGGTSITVPEQIDDTDVVSFAIDPRWPVVDEDYDQIEGISLPKTIRYAHSAYIEEFRGLKTVKMAAGNTAYKSDAQGILYKFNDEGCHVAAYPRARTSKTFVMPSDMNRFYEFFDGCQLESITISEEMPYVCADDFYNLKKLKTVYVDEENPSYYSSSGVLFTDDPDCIDSGEDDEEDEETIDEDDGDDDYDWEDEEDEEGDEDYEESVALCYYPAGKITTEYTIPADVTHIEDGAFAYNQYLQKLTIPAGIEVIAEDALIYLYDYMDGEDLLADPVLKTLVFKSSDVSDIYTDFRGVKTLYSVLKDKLNIRYPSTGKGYAEFLEWLKEEEDAADIEQEENSWEVEPEMLMDDYPLGANIIVLGKPKYGSAYAVFSSSEEGTYTKQEPTAQGTWYAKLVVDETEEYTELESEPMSFTIFEPPEGKAQNGWAYAPAENTEVRYGEDFDVSVPALYGKARVLYGTPNSNPEMPDDTEQWTEEKPEKPGQYAYMLIVDGTDKYSGTKYVSSSKDIWLIINRAPFEVRVICDDVAERSEPSPRVEFFKGTQTDKIELDKIGFVYGTYETIEGAESGDPEMGNEPDDEEFVPMAGVPVDPGEYVVRAVCQDNEYYEIYGETTFSIKSELEIVEDMIDAIAAPKDISVYSKEEVQKAIEEYEALPASVQAMISDDKVQALYDARARVESLEAKAAYEEKKDKYDQALAEYNAAKTAADNSKAAAEAAAKTPGAAAVAAAEKAEADAIALQEASEKLQAAAEELKPAADQYADKAQDDPVFTRRDLLDANKAAANAATAITAAETAATEAGQAVIDAGTAKYNAETLAEAAKEEYSKKAAAAKKLKVSGLKVKALRKKKAAVTWKVNKKGSGYDLRYSRKKSMKKAKKVTIKKAKIRKATLKKLKARKYYYVRIRTFTKLVNPETGKTVTFYGKWTRVKRFRAKK